MKNLFPAGLMLALLSMALVPATASDAGDRASLSPAIRAPILYTHATYYASDRYFMRSAALRRVNPATGLVTPLTPKKDGIFYLGGSWSPNGNRFVYERATEAMSDRSKLFTADKYGGSRILLTPGLGKYQQATWGPGRLIAFIDATRQCLASVRPDATGLRTLFCPTFMDNSLGVVWQDPQWTPDGKSIVLQVGQWVESGLALDWYTSVYRVNATTGNARLVFRQKLEGQDMRMAISPDGTEGIYSLVSDMIRVDFSTGEQIKVTKPDAGFGASYGEHYSPDGRHIAFAHHFSLDDPDHQGRVIGYIGIYVMRADGTRMRMINVERDDNPAQTVQIQTSVAGWSGDGSHVLLNRTCAHLEHGDYVPYPSLRLVDAATRKVVSLDHARGVAGEGAWYPH